MNYVDIGNILTTKYRRAVWETALGQVDQQVYGMLIYFLYLHNSLNCTVSYYTNSKPALS